MTTKNKIIILSDIHIGNNAVTNWYQAEAHEPYLQATLQYVIANKDSIQELIILGDLIDFWTYLPTVQPPDFAAIMQQNPNIFGDAKTGTVGQLGLVVEALEGKVTYVHGNHDMTVTQEMLNQIPTGSCTSIQLSSDDYYFPLGGNNSDIVCTHGHLFSMLCSPDQEPKNAISPLPLGYYVTRTGAYLAAQKLTPAAPNVAYLPNTGEPAGIDLTLADYSKILADLVFYSLGGAITAVVKDETGYGWTDPILLPDGTNTTLDDAFNNFAHLLDTWKAKSALDGQPLGYSGALSALRYPDIDNDLSSYAKAMAAKWNSKVVIMGHTHVPGDSQSTQATQQQQLAKLTYARLDQTDTGSTGAPFIYANSGFNCPSIPDMQGAIPKSPTFIDLEVGNGTYQVTVMQVVKTGNEYTVQPDPDLPPVTI